MHFVVSVEATAFSPPFGPSFFVCYAGPMNSLRELRKVATEHHQAFLALRVIEARRKDRIRDAVSAGHTVREIAEVVDLSFQRVADLAAGESGARGLTLHAAIEQILREAGGGWMPVHEVARQIFERKLYTRRDNGVLRGAQVRARAAKLPDIFEGSQDGSNQIRLRQA